MQSPVNKCFNYLAISIISFGILASCNKDLPVAEPITQPAPSGSSISETIAADANYSLLRFALNRSGLTNLLSDKSAVFTFYAADNAAFQASGLVDTNAIKSLSAAQWNAIINYNLIGGQKILSSMIPATFPSNLYLQSSLVLSAPSATLPPGYRMPVFPGKQGTGTGTYVNNVPVTQTDIPVANGIIHKIAFLNTPPSQVLKLRIAADPNLTYFNAAIARADSGQAPGLSRFDSLLNYAVLNMTLLAPNDAAFRTLIYGLVYGNVFAATSDTAIANAIASGAVAAGPAFLSTNNVSTAQIRGIIAYHILASNPKSAYEPNFRAFSVNFGITPAFVKTLVNSSLGVHPGILAQATFAGPFVSSLTFSSYGSFPPGGAPFSYTANAVGLDRHAVNGVYHIIDKVLLPQ